MIHPLAEKLKSILIERPNRTPDINDYKEYVHNSFDKVVRGWLEEKVNCYSPTSPSEMLRSILEIDEAKCPTCGRERP